jgi:hypothetical protein
LLQHNKEGNGSKAIVAFFFFFVPAQKATETLLPSPFFFSPCSTVKKAMATLLPSPSSSSSSYNVFLL